jgi:hypothetical protein
MPDFVDILGTWKILSSFKKIRAQVRNKVLAQRILQRSKRHLAALGGGP